MIKRSFPAFLVMGAVSVGAATMGCVSDRPARNGVFNENQYLRKSFLVRDGAEDPGWYLKASIQQVSTPNPLGALGFEPGFNGGQGLYRFRVTNDKLQLLNVREMTSTPSEVRTEEIVNAWPVTNVDLKYRVNYDGETTNFYEENQELDWAQRQWVKLNLSKNDASDVAPMGVGAQYALSQCVDLGSSSVTLVPGSFFVDEPNDYMEWTVSLALPLRYDVAACVQQFGFDGVAAQKLGRESVTVNLKYSMVRAKPVAQMTYQPLEIEEKDPIRHKYGPLDFAQTITRDPESGQLAARQLAVRWDPNRAHITWYFTPDFPKKYKKVFLGKGGVADQTNQILATAGAKARVEFKDFDADLAPGERPRQFGDARYSFIRWMNDKDNGASYSAVTEFLFDVRTGEQISGSIAVADFNVKDYFVQFIESYLKGVGACAVYDYGNSEGNFCSFDSNNTTEWPDPFDPKGLFKDANGNLTATLRDDKGTVIKTAPTLPCTGDTLGARVPFVPDEIVSNHNGTSTLYAKMQQYLGKLPSIYGALGPSDFIYPQDDDFRAAYYKVLPYHVFGDPDANPFVIREGGAGTYGAPALFDRYAKEKKFQEVASDIDHGKSPFDMMGQGTSFKAASSFLENLQDLTRNHGELETARLVSDRATLRMRDMPSAFSLTTIISRDARQCVDLGDGKGAHWQTRAEWVDAIIDNYWTYVLWHEFGHSMGLDHNFMASVDRPNFPEPMAADPNSPKLVRYPIQASSVMDYTSTFDRNYGGGWGPYDAAAIAWTYANASSASRVSAEPSEIPKFASITGQVSHDKPWKDPLGFQMTSDGQYKTGADGKEVERQFLFCNASHLKYTPFCKQFDLGTTPSEIIANEIDRYEAAYSWRNFRKYRKFWDESGYAAGPASEVVALRRFIAPWIYDWNTAELADTFRKIGIEDPKGLQGNSAIYYAQLGNKFESEMSAANQMMAAFHKGIIQQGSGERPFRTIYDKYYGDVTQQGIILDKLYAMQSFVGMWPTDNYDQNQAGGYVVSYGLGDQTYDGIARDVVNSMVGGQYDVYPYFVPLAVAQFAKDTHSPSFPGPSSVRDWIGGLKFDTIDYFRSYFRQLAVKSGACDKYETCTYDPTLIDDDHQEFIGPDKRQWVWTYIADRNQYFAVQKDRNTATYILMRQYNSDVIFGQDDGNGPAYSYQLSLKYTLDYFYDSNQTYLRRVGFSG